jgi:rhamnose transport system ATP-binding protein
LTIGEPLLEVEGFCHPTEFDQVSFLRKGEILGFYGLVGAGRSEVMQALFGLSPRARARCASKASRSPSRPADAIAHGIAYVPEDRQHQGAHLTLPIMHNITLPILSQIGFFLRGRPRGNGIARHFSEQLELKASHLTQHVSELSGGNQQKVVLGKWLATEPEGHHPRRADQGHRHRLEGRRAPFISELVTRGPVGDPGVVRTAGSAGHGRPRHRDAPRAHQARFERPRPRRKRWSRPHRAATWQQEEAA